jgi:tRNA (pseudouridine54-N1)-methyltransferase
MRQFLIISKNASTSPFHKDLKAAGRWDILLHSIISALFASNTFRENVQLHLLLLGPPNSPRHITIKFDNDNTISKKNLKKLLEISLRKCKIGKTIEVHKGVYVNDDNIENIIENLKNNYNMFLLDSNGEHIKNVNHNELENSTFILGDHKGFDKKIKKILNKNCKKISLGEQIYFTSQAITIINYELDNLKV